MITLSKNILAFLSEATSGKNSSRPVLRYIYYIPEHDIGININYLYNALRYFTKTSKNGLTLASIQSKDALAPQCFHSTIDGLQSSALIMPLKI